jgi:hexokinase
MSLMDLDMAPVLRNVDGIAAGSFDARTALAMPSLLQLLVLLIVGRARACLALPVGER